MTATALDLDTASAVLAHVRGQRTVENRASAEILRAAVRWASLHPAACLDDAAVLACYGDHAIAIAGPGAPLVSEFAVAEFASAMGLPTQVGKEQLGEALELAHRLPRVQARIDSGDLPAWRGRRIARETICLTMPAATHVDQQIAKFAHKIRPAEVDRLVADAIARFMPDLAAERRKQADDGRHLTIDSDHVTFAGTSFVHGELDLADALDLEAAVVGGAASLKAAGSDQTLDVRRSMAVGELARTQLSLDLNADSDTEAVDEATGRRRAKPRQVVLHVHLAQAAVTGTDGFHPARVENGRHLVTADQVRDWCNNPDTQITVKPVIDLNEHIHVSQYEVPDRLAAQVEERDLTCVFPWCSRPAAGCDKDHVIPYAAGGATASDNIANLCRRHHRLKTHSRWGYTVIEPGCYLWTSPHGLQFLVDDTGTTDVSGDRRCHPPDP